MADAGFIIDHCLSQGFSGWVGFHFYNEPTLYDCFIESVITQVPEAHYMLWTNGDFLTQSLADLFERIVVTDYGDLALNVAHPSLGVLPSKPDERLTIYDREPDRGWVRCARPSFELPVDCEGGVHLCCQDWRDTFGNVLEEPFVAIADRLAATRAELAQGTSSPPNVCRRCPTPIEEIGQSS